MKVDWDLSKRHTLDEVFWPTDRLDSHTTQLEPVSSARVKLPAERVLEMRQRTGSVILYRRSQSLNPLPPPEGRILTTVEVYTVPLEVEDAYDQALELARQLDFPRGGIDEWRERRERGVAPEVDRTYTGRLKPLGGEGGATVGVEFNYSANDERPGSSSPASTGPSPAWVRGAAQANLHTTMSRLR